MEPDKKLHYEAVLADLEAQRRELDSLIGALKKMLNNESLALSLSPSLIPVNGEVASDTFLGMSIAEAAKKCLRLKHKKQTTTQIADALEQGGLIHSSENFVATVASVLSREARQSSDLVKVARGEWGLPEWYPGLKQKRAASSPRPETDERVIQADLMSQEA